MYTRTTYKKVAQFTRQVDATRRREGGVRLVTWIRLEDSDASSRSFLRLTREVRSGLSERVMQLDGLHDDRGLERDQLEAIR